MQKQLKEEDDTNDKEAETKRGEIVRA